MNSKNDRVPSEKPLMLPPKRRFRIERLEERIAPKKGGKGTHNCGGGGSNTISGSNYY